MISRVAIVCLLSGAIGLCLAACAHASPAPPVPSATVPAPSPTPATDAYPPRAHGYSISWPQCGAPYPAPPFDIGMVGVTNGIAFTHNPCFQSEWIWALAGRYLPTVYWNVNYVECGRRDPACDPYSYGWREAEDAYDYAGSLGAHPKVWWLDIQTVSEWSPDLAHNAAAIRGAIDFFRQHGVRPAISSTSYQLATVAGDFVPGLTSFIAGREGLDGARAYCSSGDRFAGLDPELTAYVAGGYEQIVSCGRR